MTSLLSYLSMDCPKLSAVIHCSTKYLKKGFQCSHYYLTYRWNAGSYRQPFIVRRTNFKDFECRRYYQTYRWTARSYRHSYIVRRTNFKRKFRMFSLLSNLSIDCWKLLAAIQNFTNFKRRFPISSLLSNLSMDCWKLLADIQNFTNFKKKVSNVVVTL